MAAFALAAGIGRVLINAQIAAGYALVAFHERSAGVPWEHNLMEHSDGYSEKFTWQVLGTVLALS
jgi:hypothetical protein